MISGSESMRSEQESPFQGHINLLQEFANFGKEKNTRELEHPGVLATIIFVRTTIREKEFGAEEFAPHYEITKQAIQEHLGIDYLRSWIEKIETLETKYAKKKPKPEEVISRSERNPQHVPFNWGKHKDENESIDLNNTIKNILRFIKRENPDLHARLEAKIKVKTSEAKRRLADADPSERG